MIYTNSFTLQQFTTRYQVCENVLNTHFSHPHFTWESDRITLQNLPRIHNTDLSAASKIWLTEIRETYKNVILYYSGGADSHYILNEMVKHRIFPDKIITWRPHHISNKKPFDAGTESEWAELRIPTLYDDGLLPQSVVYEIHQIDEGMIERMWADPYTQVPSCASLNAIDIYCNSWVLREFRHSEDPNTCYLHGGNTPNIYLDNGVWKYNFVDLSFNAQWFAPNLINFTCKSKDFFTHYVNAIIDQIEKIPGYQEKFSPDGAIKIHNKNDIRDLIPEIRHFIPSLKGQYPKLRFAPYNTNNIVEKINSTCVKLYLEYVHAHQMRPRWYDHYLNNTDWNLAKCNIEIGGFLTNTYSIY